MSGFFALHRNIIDQAAAKVQSKGFKILFDILTIPRLQLEIQEAPYTFKERTLGETKLSYSVMAEFLWLHVSKYVGRLFYSEFTIFCLIGLSGVAAHMAVLFRLYRLGEVSFLISQSTATYTAMTSNYLLNNRITFSQQRLKGKDLLAGYGKFIAACTVGAFVNVAVADYLVQKEAYWLLAAGVGTGVGAIINYFFAKVFIWGEQ